MVSFWSSPFPSSHQRSSVYPPHRIVDSNLHGQKPGRHVLRVHVGDEPVEKELRVGEGWGSVSTLRSSKFLDLLLYPGEPPIRSDAVESIEITHSPLPLAVFGWSVNWIVFFQARGSRSCAPTAPTGRMAFSTTVGIRRASRALPRAGAV